MAASVATLALWLLTWVGCLVSSAGASRAAKSRDMAIKVAGKLCSGDDKVPDYKDVLEAAQDLNEIVQNINRGWYNSDDEFMSTHSDAVYTVKAILANETDACFNAFTGPYADSGSTCTHGGLVFIQLRALVLHEELYTEETASIAASVFPHARDAHRRAILEKYKILVADNGWFSDLSLSALDAFFGSLPDFLVMQAILNVSPFAKLSVRDAYVCGGDSGEEGRNLLDFTYSGFNVYQIQVREKSSRSYPLDAPENPPRADGLLAVTRHEVAHQFDRMAKSKGYRGGYLRDMFEKLFDLSQEDEDWLRSEVLNEYFKEFPQEVIASQVGNQYLHSTSTQLRLAAHRLHRADLIPTIAPSVAPTVAPMFEGYTCYANINLGIFPTPSECIAAAQADNRCASEIMWADVYSSVAESWGCRCCTTKIPCEGRDMNNYFTEHTIWSIYQYDQTCGGTSSFTPPPTDPPQLPPSSAPTHPLTDLPTREKSPSAPPMNQPTSAPVPPPTSAPTDPPTFAKTPAPSAAPLKGATLHKADHGCNSRQDLNLGVFENPDQCAAAALGESACTGSEIMFSLNYPSWGCRCCARKRSCDDDSFNYKYNQNWEIYKYRHFDIPTKCIAKLYKADYGCNNRQDLNLGVFNQPDACAVAALDDKRCTGSEIMFSLIAHDWGCRCCARKRGCDDDSFNYKANVNWEVFQYRPFDSPLSCQARNLRGPNGIETPELPGQNDYASQDSHDAIQFWQDASGQDVVDISTRTLEHLATNTTRGTRLPLGWFMFNLELMSGGENTVTFYEDYDGITVDGFTANICATLNRDAKGRIVQLYVPGCDVISFGYHSVDDIVATVSENAVHCVASATAESPCLSS